MRKYKRFASWFLLLLFTFGCLASTPQSAQASGLDDILSVIKQILDIVHTAAPTTSLPTSGDVDKLYNTLKCIGDGEDVIFCTMTYTKDIDNNYIDAVLDLYIAVKNEDFWAILGIVKDIGPCVLVDILTGGAGGDLCDLVKELVEAVAKAVEAIAEFFSDLAGALSDLAKAISCLFSDCSGGGPPPPPPEQVIYAQIFQPKLAEGLKKIKGPDPLAYQQYLQNLENSAYNTVAGLLVSRHVAFQYPEVWQIIYGASGVYKKNVNALWDADIAKTMPELAQKRNQYDRPEKLAEMEAKVMVWVMDYTKPMNTPYYFPPHPLPLTQVSAGSCYADFKEYAHVDAWIAIHPTEAETGQMVSNHQWCDAFATRYESQLREYFNSVVPDQCPLYNQKFRCASLNPYSVCVALKGLIGQDGACSFNIPLFGTKIAQEIDTHLNNQGSQIPCQIIVDDNNPGTDLPVRFHCTRPKQGPACNKGYDYYHNIPIKLVQCEVAEAEEYKKLKARVKQVVAILQQGGDPHPQTATWNINTDLTSGTSLNPGEKKGPATLKVKDSTVKARTDVLKNTNNSGTETVKAKDGETITLASGFEKPKCEPNLSVGAMGDPLIVQGAKCLMERLKNDPSQDVGFGPPSLKPGFDYLNFDPTFGTILSPYYKSIDGVSTPLFAALPASDGIGASSSVVMPQNKEQRPDINLQDAMDKLKNPDPIDQGSFDSKSLATLEKAGDQGVTAKSGPGNQTGKVVGLSPGILPDGGIAPHTDQTGPGTQTTPMSGTLPTNRKFGPATAALPKGAVATLNAPKPDITSMEQIKIGGSPAFWGRTVILDATRAASRNKNNSGLCEFEVECGVRNIGTADAGVFRNRWTSDAVNGTWNQNWPAIAAGAMKTDKILLPLKPGTNVLHLTLDDLGQLKETDTANNKSQINVQVSGSCSAIMPLVKTGTIKESGIGQISSGAQNVVPRQGTPSPLPDITSLNTLTIGGKGAAWGRSLALNAKDVQSAKPGVCTFQIQYTLRNGGLAPTGAFSSTLMNSTVPGCPQKTVSSISPGSSSIQNDLINLKTGSNMLTLTLDQPNLIKESDENNNQFRLIVNVDGACYEAPKSLTPLAPIKRGVPVTR